MFFCNKMVSTTQRGHESSVLFFTLPHTISSCSGNFIAATFSNNHIFTHTHLMDFFSRNYHFYLRFIISIQIVSQLALQIFSAATLIRSGRAGMVAPEKKTIFMLVVIGFDINTYGRTSVYWYVVGTVPLGCRLLCKCAIHGNASGDLLGCHLTRIRESVSNVG